MPTWSTPTCWSSSSRSPHEGEACARKLTAAGVRTTSIRYNGIIHDFLMLNPLRETAATSAAVDQAVNVLRKALKVD